ncbi:MAG TPA: HNH endonuclease [Flavobacterium sp.]|jgi:5-methylcytosine-specific restriction endonuclease McrA
MPDISKPYVFTEAFGNRLKDKFSKLGVSHTNWQDDDISDIRSSIREYYRVEQKANCAYCRQNVSLTSASNCQVEHIVPKAKYIDFIAEPKNLCVICADCNEIKRSQEVLNELPDVTTNTTIRRYPRTSNAFKIVHPHFDNYNEHLLVINGFYFDKSLKGGYTIVFCKLNRKLHKLGYENLEFSDIELMQIMTAYLSETDSLRKIYILRRLREMLILI